MRRYLALSIISIILLSGCGEPQPTQVKCVNRPWQMNPNDHGKIGAVGSSMRTYSGRTNDQRKNAITRALDELSLQQGVKVELNIDKRDKVVNDKATTSIDTKANYKTNNKVTAHIEDACRDNSSGEFFVWMLLD